MLRRPVAIGGIVWLCGCPVIHSATDAAATDHDVAVIDAGPDLGCAVTQEAQSRCHGDLLETCMAQRWRLTRDCTASGRICSDIGQSATCMCPAGTVANTQGQCVTPSGQGDTCLSALLLDVDAGQVTGSTTGRGDEYLGSCNNAGSDDVVYYFTLTAGRRLRFEVAGFDSTLYLRRVCNDGGTEISCNDDLGGGNDGSRIDVDLEPGTYFLFIDGYGNGSNDSGTYTLSIGVWCGAGSVLDPASNSCVDDPCDPNPCQTSHKTRCLTALPSYSCGCDVGYIDDGSAGCMVNPDANEWAFFVFLNADNNLEEGGYGDIEEMMNVGSTSQLHLVVLLDSASRDDGDARKLYITSGGAQVVENLGEIDMGDWQTLAAFGSWAVQTYPARHHALVMWDHGDGWKSRQRTPPLRKGFSSDDSNGSPGISIAEGDYAQALAAIATAAGGKLDLIGFDACLMATWEVADATAPYGRVFVASEETEPDTGWDFDSFLGDLVATPAMTASELAIKIVDSYADSSSADSTLSAIDLDTMDALAAAITQLANALLAHTDQFAVVEAVRGASVSFAWMDEVRDLGDFCRQLAVEPGVPADLVSAAQAVSSQLATTVIHNRTQSDYAAASGLTIYFPARHSGLDSSYLGPGAIWSARTTWDEFLAAFAN